MKKMMSLVRLGALLLLLHLLSSQVVQAQNSTAAPMNTSTSMTMNSTMSSMTTVNLTSQDKNGCGRSAALTPLLPLALAASVLHGWS